MFPGFAGSDNVGVLHLSRALDLIAQVEGIIHDAQRMDALVTISDCINTEFDLPASIKPLVLVNNNKVLVYLFDTDGYQGKCLFLRDYESCWLLPRKFEIDSGELVLDFYYQAPRMFGPKNGMLWDIIRGDLDDDRYFWLFFDDVSGKICFAVGKRNAKKKIEWQRFLSKTERWPGNIWQKLTLAFGKSGIHFSVNGELEIEEEKPVVFNMLENLQIGRRFVSVGRYDELRVVAGSFH